MNILFKGPYPQRDGWGQASRDFIRALKQTGEPIKIMPIIMANLIGNGLDEDIKSLEETEIPHVDVFIQHALPSFMERRPNCINVGLCATETNNLQFTGWVEKINEMDALLCWTDQEKSNLRNSGVRIPIQVMPQPMNTEFFDSVSDQFDDPAVNDNFVFYFIGEWNERKNLNDLIFAYWREFTREEEVRLLLKVNKGGLSPDVLGKNILNHLEKMKQVYRLWNKASYYPEVMVVSEYLSNEDLVRLHRSCNCFVTTSYGEATCIPLLNALYLDKTVISTKDIGAVDSEFDIITAESHEVPCMCGNPPLPYLYSGWETWRQVSIIDLQKKMREVFNGKQCHNSPAKVSSKYSYGAVSERIKNFLSKLHLSKVG